MKTRKILLPLIIIAATLGVVGYTGAWWSDSATSTNTSFSAGMLDLTLSNDGSSWADSVSQTWDITNLSPGGDSYEDSLYLRNEGSITPDWLKFATQTHATPGSMDNVLRVTKLDYAGENLLEDGAGAHLNEYEAPENCDTEVNFGDNDYKAISAAVDDASDGDVICIGPGNYSSSWENSNGSGYPIAVDTLNITIVGMHTPNGDDATKVSVTDPSTTEAFLVTADGVTIQGLQVNGTGTTFSGNQLAGIQLSPTSGNTELADVTVKDNLIYDLVTTDPGAASKGVQLFVDNRPGALPSGVFKNVVITNNEIHDIGSDSAGAYGVQTVGELENVTLSHNTTRNVDGAWEAGIALDSHVDVSTTATVELNDPKSATLSIQVKHKVAGKDIRVKQNNLESLLHGGGGSVVTNETMDATNNWWGDYDPSDQVYGDVDTSNFAGNAFIGLVNGEDPNSNGFADLDDLRRLDVVVNSPDLQANSGNNQTLDLGVQLDGPTSNNNHQGGNVGVDVTATMGQGPVQ